MSSSKSYPSSEEEGAVAENAAERQAGMERGSPNNRNGVKRSRSALSFGKEEKKEENGSKLTPRNEENAIFANEMKMEPKDQKETVVGENTPPIPFQEEEEEGNVKPSSVVKQQQQQEQPQARGDNAESAYSSKIRSSDRMNTSERRGDRSRMLPQQQQQYQQPAFGLPVEAKRKGNFPDTGSMLGHFFCAGKLGAGTFSSIHKCINLDYFNEDGATRRRLAAAKVELSDFSQSGVLESEATILDFLHQKLPPQTVPVYMGHYKSGNYAAILMEYLPGEDMHFLRENVMAGTQSRRISVKDAVYLTADVMIPLLQEMHKVGVVHRDVKPSNCVRSGVDENDKAFCMVDFGLSKSIVVPEASAFADSDHPWTGKDWLKPKDYDGPACFRKEREKAEFRGTSMYASPRVHQMRDYCPRDDVWSALYVFCDLVSGGLPWMSHAANRERDTCQKLKEAIHGESGPDQTEQLLMGDEYHVIKYRNEMKKAAGDTNKPYKMPEPLAMSKDEAKINHLRTAFRHLATLQFWDTPDYALVQKCIKGFLDDESNHPTAKPIDWKISKVASQSISKRESSKIPSWQLLEEIDPLEEDVFEEAENIKEASEEDSDPEYLGRLPLLMQFRYQQVDYHQSQRDRTPIHVVLRDWLDLVLPLLYEEWDAKKYEEGGHRTATDGYRRETYLLMLRKAWDCAQEFGFFQSAECVFHPSTKEGEPLGKKRKISSDGDSVLTTIARAIFYLEHTIREEEAKRSPPPRMLSFGA